MARKRGQAIALSIDNMSVQLYMVYLYTHYN